jgi:ribosomal protein S27E
MNVEYLCPHCRAENRAGTLPAENVICKKCGQQLALPVSAESQATGMIERFHSSLVSQIVPLSLMISGLRPFTISSIDATRLGWVTSKC